MCVRVILKIMQSGTTDLPKADTKQRWSEDHTNTRGAVIGLPNYINSNCGFLNFFCCNVYHSGQGDLNISAIYCHDKQIIFAASFLTTLFSFDLGSYCALEIPLHTKLMCCNQSHPQLIRKLSCLSISPTL